MKKSIYISLLLFVMTLALTACSRSTTQSNSSSSSSNTSSSESSNDSENVTIIEIKNLAFPSTIKIKKGETIKWINKDSMVHNVVFSSGGVSSGTLSQNDTFEHTFDETGTFEYVCTFHSGMKGKIVVE